MDAAVPQSSCRRHWRISDLEVPVAVHENCCVEEVSMSGQRAELNTKVVSNVSVAPSEMNMLFERIEVL